MKTLKFLLPIFLLLALTDVKAQSSTLRGNKATVLITKTDAAGADTIKLEPSEFRTIVKHSLTDSVNFRLANLTRCHVGDELIFVITNTSGSNHKVKLNAYTGFEVSSADSIIAITSAKRANISFIFDGVKFVQTSIIKQ